MTRDQSWESAVLAYDLLSEEPKAETDRAYVNRVLTATRDGICLACSLTVETGTQVRAFAASAGGRLIRGRVCEPCCDAMADMTRQAPQHLMEQAA